MQTRTHVSSAVIKLKRCAENLPEAASSDLGRLLGQKSEPIHFNPQKPLSFIITKLQELERYEPHQLIRPLSKPAVHEDSNTVLTKQFAAAVRFGKRSINTSFIEELRADLNCIFFQPAIRDTALEVAVHAALIALAEIAPTNDIDDTTREAIPEDNRIVFSTGRQYNVLSILANLRAKPNLLFQLPSHEGNVHKLDIAHFKKMLRGKNIKLPPIREKETDLISNSLIHIGTFLWGTFFHSKNSNKNIQIAISELQNHGITEQDFRQYWRRLDAWNDFSFNHMVALQHLILIEHLDKIAAFGEINLLNENQVYALSTLYKKGLRGDKLREWYNNDIKFSAKHADALIFFMRDCTPPLCLEDALLELDQLNVEEISSLLEFYHQGLRGRHFGYRCGAWLSSHGILFNTLVNLEGLSPEQAMQESTELSSTEALILNQFYRSGIRGIDLRLDNKAIITYSYWLSKKEKRQGFLEEFQKKHSFSDLISVMKEIYQLNESECSALFNLYDYGLRGEHLRACFPREDTSPNENPTKTPLFEEVHLDILTFLIKDKKYPVMNVCEALKGKTKEEVLDYGTYFHHLKYAKYTIGSLLTFSLMLCLLPTHTAWALMAGTMFMMKTKPTPNINLSQNPTIEPPNPAQDEPDMRRLALT